MEIQSRLYANQFCPTFTSARAENIKPPSLEKINSPLPLNSATLKAYFLSKPRFGSKGPTKHQVLVVPIGIGEIKPGRDIQVGSTSVLKVEGKSQKPIPIDVYRMIQDGTEKSSQKSVQEEMGTTQMPEGFVQVSESFSS